MQRVNDARTFRRVRRGRARLKEMEERELDSKKREQEMADHRVEDVEDWIRIVQTRTRAIELLRKYGRGREVAEFLEEIS